MGVSCPQLSDEPSYTMVESSGGSCRCTCQDDVYNNQEEHHQSDNATGGCCSPQVFTSILLGILACVLMTGGVFLAFHRWDPMWLMVSGVGVILIIIGTILHCCNNFTQRPKRHSSAGKGCCARPLPPDHGGHIINNGSLTEQLLPLSNARSVSQLSLNMLPGYFPPVVTAYGIEQHSAVVQNINRLIQQQQQQQQQQPQQPQSPGSISQGMASNAGKSFIVLSLPADASAANIQNLVATVYQLDGNTTESSANEVVPNIISNVVGVKPNSPTPLILKNVEVQTCNVWPTSPLLASTVGESSTPCRSTSIEESSVQTTSTQPIVIPSSSCGSTQTDGTLPTSSRTIPNLIDCSTNISPIIICDNSQNACDNQTTDNNNGSSLMNIPSSSSSSADLLDVTLQNCTPTVVECATGGNVLVDIPELLTTEPPSVGGPTLDATITTTANITSPHPIVDVVVNPTTHHPQNCAEVLVDIFECNNNGDVNGNSMINNNNTLLEGLNNNVQQSEVHPLENPDSVTITLPTSSNNDNLILDLSPNVSEISDSPPDVQTLNPEMLASTSNLSAVDTEIDDGELMDRSSPPPSYEDVTLEGENATGAFGLAYGTI